MNTEDSSIDTRIAQALKRRVTSECSAKVISSRAYRKAGKPEFTVSLDGPGAIPPVVDYSIAGDGYFVVRGEALIHSKSQGLAGTTKYSVSGQVGVILAEALTPGINAALSRG